MALTGHINECIRARSKEVIDFPELLCLVLKKLFYKNTDRPEPDLVKIFRENVHLGKQLRKTATFSPKKGMMRRGDIQFWFKHNNSWCPCCPAQFVLSHSPSHLILPPIL